MAAPNEITPQQLSRLIGTPDCPVLVDTCIDEDFQELPKFIPGTIRMPFGNVDAIADLIEARSGSDMGRAVIICQKGKKLSQGVVAHLRLRGIEAENLEGGILAWHEMGLPLIEANAFPGLGTPKGSLWVTRHRPKVDRIACPWLIRRFADPAARFLFVSPSEVTAVAEKFGAIPFDIEDVHWSHRGDACTFDTMIDEFGLSDPAIETMRTIIRGADTSRHDLMPEVAGVFAILVGLSRVYRDDNAQLEAGLVVLDLLYRWARDGRNETHNWPNPAGAVK